ncbi:MAG: hypothetical protein IM618_14455 [Cytophagales bacterium]|jgi:hypothetical protein|nr:hypothetical protein [Cytophagales bacterium]
MRTISLSEEQFNLLSQALGIAERAYSNTHSNIVSNLVRVRGNEQSSVELLAAQQFHDKACAFADLHLLIKNGDLDS